MRDRHLDSRIRRLKIRRMELMSCLEPGSMRYDQDRVQTSPKDTVATIFAEVDVLDREIEALQEQRAATVIEVSNAIEQMEDDREKTVLAMFFLERRRMEEIASEMHYSMQHAYRLRVKGIEHLGEKMA